MVLTMKIKEHYYWLSLSLIAVGVCCAIIRNEKKKIKGETGLKILCHTIISGMLLMTTIMNIIKMPIETINNLYLLNILSQLTR
jgi:hypothetical protein